MVSKKDEKLFGIFSCLNVPPYSWPWYYQRGSDSMAFRVLEGDTLEKIAKGEQCRSLNGPDKFLLPLEFLE